MTTHTTRRTMMAAMGLAPIAAALPGCAATMADAPPSATTGPFVTRAINGVAVPVIGIGTARSYADPAPADMAELKATVAEFARLGGKVIDTAPSYGRAEEVVGQIVAELGVRDRLYLATKVAADDLATSRAQIEESFTKLRTDRIDLIAVHNLRNWQSVLPYLRDLRSAGRIGAVGITTSFDRQYEELAQVIASEQLDCLQVDYALDQRSADERILPMAAERDLPTMINLPFGRGRLFAATEGMALPGWAADIGAASWAQVFLKYLAGHPARPIPIPGTARVRYAIDNLGAARPPLPDQAMRRMMENFIDAL